MSTTREEILSAIELAAQVLPEADRAANHRESFITVLGLDPRLVGQGRGKRAAYILQAVVVALRKWDRKPDVAASREPDADQRAEQMTKRVLIMNTVPRTENYDMKLAKYITLFGNTVS